MDENADTTVQTFDANLLIEFMKSAKSPSASFNAVSKLSGKRFLIPSLITSLSTTTEILCLIFFSKWISSCKS